MRDRGALDKTIAQCTRHGTGVAGTNDWPYLHHDAFGSPELTTNTRRTG